MVSVCIASPSQNTRQLISAKKAKVTSPEKVLQSFNTWAFKREQPSDPKLILGFVTQAIERHAPISFVLYWGKGPRSCLASPDIECLDYLAAFGSRVRESYARGASINIVLTDTHARLNGHAQSSIEQYFGDIEDAAGERGFDCCRLSELVHTAGDIVEKALAEPAPIETLDRLARCAAKWYAGEGTAEYGALQYYRMNMVEKRAIELAFPHAIFVTFNGSEYRSLFPDRLPIFYMYSLRRGVGVKPWFLPGESTSELPSASAKEVLETAV